LALGGRRVGTAAERVLIAASAEIRAAGHVRVSAQAVKREDALTIGYEGALRCRFVIGAGTGQRVAARTQRKRRAKGRSARDALVPRLVRAVAILRDAGLPTDGLETATLALMEEKPHFSVVELEFLRYAEDHA
jgi:hypothetical protein